MDDTILSVAGLHLAYGGLAYEIDEIYACTNCSSTSNSSTTW